MKSSSRVRLAAAARAGCNPAVNTTPAIPALARPASSKNSLRFSVLCIPSSMTVEGIVCVQPYDRG
jgi:hypothetical protein